MPFPDSFLQELKLRSDITEIASSYVNLKRHGRNMVGLCPFHGEKTPSFNIYTESGSFYCFGCGAGGDVITFIMKIENLDYVEAVKFLAQRAGMEMPENTYDDSLSKLRMRIYEANREAARFFHATLLSQRGQSGLNYLRGRALSDRTIRHFGLGFADDDWNSLCNHLKNKGFSEYEIYSANLAFKRKNGNGIYDRFVNRVMFPIIDLRGNVIAFGGRIMTDEKPKYLNTSDTPVFKKSENLFSLNNAKSSGTRTLILCEGYMDVIALNQAGFTNAVATLGTALTNEQAVLMKRYADEVIICYDADGAGQKATARAIDILRNAGLPIKILTVPSGKDPDEFIRSKGENGPAAFKLLIEKCGNDIEYRLMKLKENYNLNTTDGKVAFLNEAVKIVATIESPIERDVFASKLCAELEIDKNAFLEQISKVKRRDRRENIKKETRQIQAELNGQSDKINREHYKKPRSSSAEEALLVYLINNPDYANSISERVTPDKFSNSLIKRYYEYVLSKIKSGYEPLTSVSSDFNSDEVSYLYKLISTTIPAASTREAVEEYINVINEESNKLTSDKLADMSADDINDYIMKLKQNKK
ncbi:DNA primase [Ruminococcus sp. FMB-CY1]|uniref:DNA primase n=1 Tax=unclassified Ruminococcus TaxID=2608920 RepID=UPI00208F162E|nr:MULTISPECIES: DNA primase [unclassified Ruminococcus]USP69875.1 DNA primase [Ruminococcus sp. FMBCY1]WBX56815.1 DNA primase [Ruminococcus sp. FMB-CY1]